MSIYCNQQKGKNTQCFLSKLAILIFSPKNQLNPKSQPIQKQTEDPSIHLIRDCILFFQSKKSALPSRSHPKNHQNKASYVPNVQKQLSQASKCSLFFTCRQILFLNRVYNPFIHLLIHYCIISYNINIIMSEELTPRTQNNNNISLKTTIKTRPSYIRVKPKNTELQDYDLGQTIGEGGFGFVRKATHLPTGQTVAVKICSLSSYDSQQLRALQQEIDLQRHILHQNIIQVYQVIKTNTKIYIFMEYCKNGQLFERINRIGPLPQKEAAKIFHQILAALIYLRQNNLSHRDIKPQNILFDKNWNAKLIDFGFSCTSEQGQMRKTICGTPSYMPPQILKKVPYDSELADVWSLGVTLYAMLGAKLPFDGDSPQKRKMNILSLKYTMQPTFSQRAQKLLSSIFVQPKYRPKLQDLLRSEFALYFEAPLSKSVNFKNQSIQLEIDVVDTLGSTGYDVQTISQSVKECKLNKYRTLYFLTLKKQQKYAGKEQLSSFRKHKKMSTLKLTPLAKTPTLIKKTDSKQFQDILQMKTSVLKHKESKVSSLNEIMSTVPTVRRPRKNSIDSPLRLADCLSAYKLS